MAKLVRARDLIRASGRSPRVGTVVVEQHRGDLRDKLHGEVAELVAAERDAVLAEAADVLEVLAAIAAEHGATIDTIIDVGHRKRAERGGFTMRTWLDGIDEKPSAP